MICIQALTGVHPRTLPSDPTTGSVIWHYSTADRNLVEVSPGLEYLLNKMVHYHFRDRYESAAEALEALHRVSHRSSSKKFKPHYSQPQKTNQFKKRWIVLGLAIATVALGLKQISQLGKPTCSLEIGDNLSCGEEVLSEGFFSPEKEEGIKAFYNRNYKQAVTWFELARKKLPADPETLIYLNNSKLILNNIPYYTIAVAVPLGNPSDGGDSGREILRGVAQMQAQVNQDKSIHGAGLRVVLADDSNNPVRAQQVAQELGKRPEILGVVGHYTSGNTRAALPVYEKYNLALISPTSTAQTLAQDSTVFFRTVPQDQVTAQALAQYIYQQAKQQKVALFYNPNSNYSSSLRDQFLSSFDELGGLIVRQFDLSKPFFDADATITEAAKRGAQALVLFPDAKENPYSFTNGLKVIRMNQNRYLVAGGDSLYSSDILAERKAAEKVIVGITWHELSSNNLGFTRTAQEFWGSNGNVSWRTAMAADATQVLKVAFESQSSLSWIKLLQARFDPNIRREQILKTLRQPNFKTQGATGEISFKTSGDRAQTVAELVKVVPSRCSPYGYVFIPVEYKTAQEAGLKCN